jgi:arylsulfatase
VVIILLDDTGFAQLGCFGSDIETPNIDRLAEGGLRYHRFHVTALCSPTRACILTGRNHHSVGMGFLTDIPTGFPGYSGRIPRSAATLPRVLRDAGYNTMAVGKWHLTPRWDQTASGPFDRWPLGLGFERYYGFPAGDTNHYAPNLISDNHYIEPPRSPDEGYHLTEDLADQAIAMIGDQQETTPHLPFFLYFATGAMHAPHHAPPDWIERYRGRFDDGWDAWRERVFARQVESGVVPAGTTLTERPNGVAAWDDVDEEHQRLYARQMEVFAGFLSHTDHQIGRIIDFLEEQGVLDDTIIMLCSDNGTSAEGGVHGSFNEHAWALGSEDDVEVSLARMDELGGHRAYNHYSWGWAWAGNTPLKLWKRYTWLGGVRTPLIVHWPNGIAARGEVRSQFCHAVDLSSTVLDAAGIEWPSIVDGIDQQPVNGASLVPTFADGDAPARDSQYFEMLGSRAMVHGSWKAVTDHISHGVPDEEALLDGSRDFETDRWCLFDLDRDFSEAHDVADEHPEVVARLESLWWAEAGRNHVLPLDDSLIQRAMHAEPSTHPQRYRRAFRPGGRPIAEEAIPPLFGGFRVHVDVDAVESGVSGVLCAQGDWNNGWAVLALDGHLAYVLSRFGVPYRVVADEPIPAGTTQLRVEYTREDPGGGSIRLFCGEQAVGEGNIPKDLPFRWQIGGARFHIGLDRGLPVSDDYAVPFPYTGTIRRVVFELPQLAFLEPDPEQVEHFELAAD